LALDNKLFSYVMAGLPVLATQQPEYRKAVEEYGVGVCVDADQRDAYWQGFQRIVADYGRFRKQSLLARDSLNWEREERVLVDLYGSLERTGSSR
jgi:hypothetical protein